MNLYGCKLKENIMNGSVILRRTERQKSLLLFLSLVTIELFKKNPLFDHFFVGTCDTLSTYSTEISKYFYECVLLKDEKNYYK